LFRSRDGLNGSGCFSGLCCVSGLGRVGSGCRNRSRLNAALGIAGHGRFGSLGLWGLRGRRKGDPPGFQRISALSELPVKVGYLFTRLGPYLVSVYLAGLGIGFDGIDGSHGSCCGFIGSDLFLGWAGLPLILALVLALVLAAAVATGSGEPKRSGDNKKHSKASTHGIPPRE